MFALSNKKKKLKLTLKGWSEKCSARGKKSEKLEAEKNELQDCEVNYVVCM